MKLARLFLAAAAAITLGACSDSVTAPEVQPSVDAPARNIVCTGTITLEKATDGTVVVLCNGMPTMGSGG